VTSVDTVRDFFRFLTETPDRAFEDGFRPLWRTLKNREQMRLLVPELLPGAEMARTEGTVDTVELNRNQSSSQALSGARVAKRKAAHPTGSKTGRNEPCPCGSGKKYKKCCGRLPQ
jgi:preprotein translocase subunit SecA